MKQTKKIIILAILLLLISGTIYVATLVFFDHKHTTTITPLLPIVMDDSGLTLSKIISSKQDSHLIFSGKISETHLEDVDKMGSSSKQFEPTITYFLNDENVKLRPEGFSFSHIDEDVEIEYLFKKLPKDIEWIYVTLGYKNKNGIQVEYTTPQIDLVKK
jgi:hypothetical protein